MDGLAANGGKALVSGTEQSLLGELLRLKWINVRRSGGLHDVAAD
jgi:hypothetical protein